MAVVLATGFFDGVHTGHRLVIRELVRSANERGVESVVVTFWPHPRNVLQDDARNLRLLTSLEEKKLQLSALGVDWIEVLTFSRDFSQHTTAEYLRDIVRGRFGASAIVLGYDNRIGNDNLSTIETAAIARGLGMEVIHVPRTGGFGCQSEIVFGPFEQFPAENFPGSAEEKFFQRIDKAPVLLQSPDSQIILEFFGQAVCHSTVFFRIGFPLFHSGQER